MCGRFARRVPHQSSTREGWGIASNAAHPGFTKTNLQSSGPSHGKDSPTLLARFYGASRQLASFMWQEVDEGIQPALYGAVSPGAQGGTFYGPRGFLEQQAAASSTPEFRGTAGVRLTAGGSGRSPSN